MNIIVLKNQFPYTFADTFNRFSFYFDSEKAIYPIIKHITFIDKQIIDDFSVFSCNITV